MEGQQTKGSTSSPSDVTAGRKMGDDGIAEDIERKGQDLSDGDEDDREDSRALSALTAGPGPSSSFPSPSFLDGGSSSSAALDGGKSLPIRGPSSTPSSAHAVDLRRCIFCPPPTACKAAFSTFVAHVREGLHQSISRLHNNPSISSTTLGGRGREPELKGSVALVGFPLSLTGDLSVARFAGQSSVESLQRPDDV